MFGSVNFEGCDLPMKISIAPTDSLAITSDPPTTSAQTTARNNPQTATNSLMDASYLTQDDIFKNLELDSNLVELQARFFLRRNKDNISYQKHNSVSMPTSPGVKSKKQVISPRREEL